MMVDEADIDLVAGGSGQTGRGIKRPAEALSPTPQRPSKRKAGPLSRDIVLRRPFSPAPSSPTSFSSAPSSPASSPVSSRASTPVPPASASSLFSAPVPFGVSSSAVPSPCFGDGLNGVSVADPTSNSSATTSNGNLSTESTASAVTNVVVPTVPTPSLPATNSILDVTVTPAVATSSIPEPLSVSLVPSNAASSTTMAALLDLTGGSFPSPTAVALPQALSEVARPESPLPGSVAPLLGGSSPASPLTTSDEESSALVIAEDDELTTSAPSPLASVPPQATASSPPPPPATSPPLPQPLPPALSSATALVNGQVNNGTVTPPLVASSLLPSLSEQLGNAVAAELLEEAETSPLIEPQRLVNGDSKGNSSSITSIQMVQLGYLGMQK